MVSLVEKLDKRKRRIVARLVAENRHFVRGKLCLQGRFLAPNGWEYPCTVQDISPGGMRVKADVNVLPGKSVVMMLEEMGRVEGEVVRTTSDGFALSVRCTAKKRDQWAEKLIWLLNADRLGLSDDRAGNRKQRKDIVHVTLADGTVFQAQAIDISPTGMAIQSDQKVTLHEPVLVGRLRGQICRLLPDGFAVRFDPPIKSAPPPAKVQE